MPKGKRKIKSIEVGFEIIDELREKEGARIVELAESLDRSESTVHTYLSTLRELGYVEKDGHTYRVGLQFLPTGEYARNREEVYLAGRNVISSLAEETGEYVHLIVARDGRQIKVYEQYGDKAVATEHHIRHRESREPLHRSAAGKAILSEYPEEVVEKIIDKHGLEGATENTITDRTELLDELDTIRKRGYATNDQEITTGLRSVGAPIIGPENSVRGAISMTAPVERCREERFHEEFPEMVQESSNVIQINIDTENYYF